MRAADRSRAGCARLECEAHSALPPKVQEMETMVARGVASRLRAMIEGRLKSLDERLTQAFDFWPFSRSQSSSSFFIALIHCLHPHPTPPQRITALVNPSPVRSLSPSDSIHPPFRYLSPSLPELPVPSLPPRRPSLTSPFCSATTTTTTTTVSTTRYHASPPTPPHLLPADRFHLRWSQHMCAIDSLDVAEEERSAKRDLTLRMDALCARLADSIARFSG